MLGLIDHKYCQVCIVRLYPKSVMYQDLRRLATPCNFAYLLTNVSYQVLRVLHPLMLRQGGGGVASSQIT